MKPKPYHEVRKVAHDTLWHALYRIGGRITWDRVTEAEAIKISRRLIHDVP